MRTIVKLPFSNVTMNTHTGKVRATAHSLMHPLMSGSGMGSILLSRAGGGAGSTYMDLDDYLTTTGIDPFQRTKTQSKGEGLRKLGQKLAGFKLSDEPKKLRKNITM